MKNVIFILADSIISDCMSNGRTLKSSTPFIDKLASQGFYANNVYSYGPYTDAATIGLYCANPTLENYGYYFGINTSKYNHFKIFKNAGYNTFGLFYPYYLISSKTKKDIDNPIYTAGFKYESVWGGKLKYYQDIKKTRELSDLEYKLIEKCMNMVFDCWLGFYSDIEDSHSACIINNLKDDSIKRTGLVGLNKEYNKYMSNPRDYIDDLLSLGLNHPIAKINEFDYGAEKYKKFLKEIYKKHNREMKTISRVNYRYALKNSPIKASKATKQMMKFLSSRSKEDLRYFINYGMLFFANNMMIKRSLADRSWQEVASLNKQIEVLIKAINDRTDKNTPFYASLHALEPHHNISYFSFDSFNHELIDEEFRYFMPLLNGLGDDFSGNVIYQLSLRYVDLCIKRLVKELKRNDLLNDTIIVLVADHGSSYSFNPLRNTVVNTFHKENYNIPVMIWSNDMKQSQKMYNSSFFMSDDILPTVLSIAGLDNSMLKGHDMTKDIQGRPYILTEYMGPGVPDMLTREIWMSIRNNNYVLGYKALINKCIDLDKPNVFYNLKKDKNEYFNSKTVNNNEISELKKLINNRFLEIKQNTYDFIENIDSICI